MNVLITGHAGYIGGVLADQLQAGGHTVIGFDIAADTADDIVDSSRVQSVFDDHDIDLVYHLAAEADVWVEDWRHLLETNVMGTVNVVEAAREAAVPVVFTSSVAAAGEFNRYGQSKDLAEQALSEYEGVTTVRLPNVIGESAPRGQAQSMIEQGLTGEIEVWGNGDIRRSYVDVRDLCRALIELGTGSIAIETPASLFAHSATNRELGEIMQRVIADETGTEPSLSVIERMPPSPQVLTAADVRLRNPRSLDASIQSQVRAVLE